MPWWVGHHHLITVLYTKGFNGGGWLASNFTNPCPDTPVTSVLNSAVVCHSEASFKSVSLLQSKRVNFTLMLWSTIQTFVINISITSHTMYYVIATVVKLQIYT